MTFLIHRVTYHIFSYAFFYTFLQKDKLSYTTAFCLYWLRKTNGSSNNPQRGFVVVGKGDAEADAEDVETWTPVAIAAKST